MSGALGLTTPWARGVIREQSERDAIQARIPDGHHVTCGAGRSRSDWSVRLIRSGERPGQGVVVFELHHWRDLRKAIDAVLAWADANVKAAA